MSTPRLMRGETRDAVPRNLLLLLTVLVLLGIVGTGASIVNAQATNSASKQDVARNVDLTQRLTDLTEQLKTKQQDDSASAVKFRNDTRLLILAICANTENAARKVGAVALACPDVVTSK